MKFIILLLLAVMVCGCSSIEYDPDTGRVKYSRIGGQKLKDVQIQLADGGVIMFGSQESEEMEPVLRSAIAGAVEGAIRGAKFP